MVRLYLLETFTALPKNGGKGKNLQMYEATVTKNAMYTNHVVIISFDCTAQVVNQKSKSPYTWEQALKEPAVGGRGLQMN